MVTLNLANIPSGIDTVEKLHVWSSLILNEMLGGGLYNELPATINDTGVRQISIADTFTDASGTRRILTRASVPLDSAVNSGGLPIYMYATDLAIGNAPTGYLEV
ncbi:MAG: hypothetical protein AAF215_31570 [Cyanobacteria bacterium P01_A01_bin.123]